MKYERTWNLIETLYKERALENGKNLYFFCANTVMRKSKPPVSAELARKQAQKDLRKERLSQRTDRIYQLLQKQLLLLRHPGIQSGISAATACQSGTDPHSACQNGYELGYRSFVLQGGEDPYYSDERMVSVSWKHIHQTHSLTAQSPCPLENVPSKAIRSFTPQAAADIFCATKPYHHSLISRNFTLKKMSLRASGPMSL